MVACGSVDDGKSTLIGRLLVETGSVPLDTLEQARSVRRGGSIIPVGEIDYSLLTDGLEAEREQGITIDVAYRQLELATGRRVIIADAPGHEQYTRNMAVAASRSDVAILLVDATRGAREQTHRHLTVCGLMGVTDIAVAVNKCDAVGWRESVVTDILGHVRATAARLGIPRVTAIPVSALHGDNVTAPSRHLGWYDGPTVLQWLQTWQPTSRPATGTRLPVVAIVRSDGDFRGYSGTLSGSLRVGERIAVLPAGTPATIDRITTFDGDLPEATAGQAITVTLCEEVDVRRGDVLTNTDPSVGPPGRPADRFAADLVWMAEEPLAHGRSYLLVSGPTWVPATVTTIRHRLDVTTGHQTAARTLSVNDIGRVEIATDHPIALDAYQVNRDTGGFLLVDRLTCDTVAAGMTRHALRRAFNVVPHAFRVGRAERSRLNGHAPRVLWLTGLPGSGKSTLANEAETQLHHRGIHTYVLDGDNLRTGLNKDLGFTPEDRAENVRRVGEVARLLLDAGLVVLVALVSPFRSDREAVRARFEPGEFSEIWVDTPLAVCAERDPKGLYRKAASGSLPNMTGVGQDYEPPEHADLILDGSADLSEQVQRLIDHALG